MKKKLLVCLTAFLLCALFCVAAAAAGGSTSTLVTTAPTTALTEGTDIDVFILISPFVKVGGSGADIKSVARLVGDPSDANKALTLNKNTSALVYGVSYSQDDFEFRGATYAAAPGNAGDDAQSTKDGTYPYFAFYGASYNGTNVFVPVVDSATGGLVKLDFGSKAAGGFAINHSAVPESAVVAKLTFRVKSGAVGGDAVAFNMTMDYKISGDAQTQVKSSVSVKVAAGCDHEGTSTAIEHAGNREMTCYQSAIQWYHCSECGNDYFLETATTVPHSYAKTPTPVEGEEATCTRSGHVACYCTNAGCTEYDPETYATQTRLGHSFSQHPEYAAADCEHVGYEFWYCERCGLISADGKNAAATAAYYDAEHTAYFSDSAFTSPLDVSAAPATYFKTIPALGHDYEEYTPDDPVPGTVYYCCKNDPSHTREVKPEDLVRYASQSGTGSGLTKESPTTLIKAFEAFTKLPAGCEATVYIIGKVTVEPNSYTEGVHAKAFEEAHHDAHITITSADVSDKSELFFPFSTTSMYFTSGPDTFENIKITSDAAGANSGSSPSITIAARGNKLVMGEGIETPNTGSAIPISGSKGTFSMGEKVEYDYPNSKIYLLGGYYSDYAGPVPEVFNPDLTVKSGDYWFISVYDRAEGTAISDSHAVLRFDGEDIHIHGIYLGNKAKLTDVTIDVHYMKPLSTTGSFYRGANGDASPDYGYTVNHFFYGTFRNFHIREFNLAGASGTTKHATYHIAYQNEDAKKVAQAFYDKGTANPGYGEVQDLVTFTEWCVKYGGGHDWDDKDVCTFCGIHKCAEHDPETVVLSVADCTHTGLTQTYCKTCFEILSEDVTQPNPDLHNYRWEKVDDGYICRCANNEAHVIGSKIDNVPTTIYVDDNGTGSGLTADAPISSFTEAMRLAAWSSADVKICIVGKANLAPNKVSLNNTNANSFEEFKHTNTITVTSASGKTGTLNYPADVAHYYLYGPTVFKNMQFTCDKPGSGVLIAARAFKLVLDTGLSMPNDDSAAALTMKKTDSGIAGFGVNTTVSNLKLYVIGGFQSKGLYDGCDTATYHSDVTVNSGEYWAIAGLNRSVAEHKNATATLHIGAVKSYYVFGLSIGASKMTDVQGDIHFTDAFTALSLPRGLESAPSGNFAGSYTINVIFHAGAVGSKIGDNFIGGDYYKDGDGEVVGSYSVKKEFNLFYEVSKDGDMSNDPTVLGILSKGEKYAAKYGETKNVSAPAYVWCTDYNPAHVHAYKDGVCVNCGSRNCGGTHTDLVKVTDFAANCSYPERFHLFCENCLTEVYKDAPDLNLLAENGNARYFMLDDAVKAGYGDYIGEDVDPNNHNFRWTAEDDGVVVSCCLNAQEKYEETGDDTYLHDGGTVDVSDYTGAIYVSDKGVGNGGFSKERPLNDLANAFELAELSAAEKPVIYILGTCQLSSNDSNGRAFVFTEPAHTKEITVRGPVDGIGVLRIGDASATSVLYNMSGDTKFENIEFSSGAASMTVTLAARHHHLTMGENISVDFMRTANGTDRHGSDFRIMGGCFDANYKAASGADTHLTLCSGTYQYVICGDYGFDCASTGTIKIEILGDVTVKKDFLCGSKTKAVGDVIFTLNGNLTVGTNFCIAGNSTDAKAKSVTFRLEHGQILSEAFPGLANGAIPLRAFGSYENYVTEGVPSVTYKDMLQDGGTFTVYYDPKDAGSVATKHAFEFSAARGDFPIAFLLIGDQSVCTVNIDGKHNGTTYSDATHTDTGSTCSVQGLKWYKCADCEQIYYVAQDLLAHNFGDSEHVVVNANCMSANIYEKVCSVCGLTQRYFKDDDTEKGDHSYNDDGICVYCNRSCEHTFGPEEAITVNCGSGKSWVCTKCGYVKVEITAASHNFGKYTVTVEPTETTPGIKTRKCKDCGKVETALLYATDAISDEAFAIGADGQTTDFTVDSLKLKKTEKAALNALLQDQNFGSEVKISYKTNGDVITGVTYSIPVPEEYRDLQNVKIVIKDDNGELHTVEFKIEKGYFVFTY